MIFPVFGNLGNLWGCRCTKAMYGGDTCEVQDQLRNVTKIQATERAFAGIRTDGRVVTWGDAEYGGNSFKVQDQLRNVQQIQATSGAFAAIADGKLVVWGHPDHGGDLRHQVTNIRQIQSTKDGSAFAAILGDGRVLTWGTLGVKMTELIEVNAQQLQATSCAFAAVADGCVVCWGHPGKGGALEHQLRQVQRIQATHFAFCAILADGTAVTWGDSRYGGDSSNLDLREVQQVQATQGAFAAILGNGRVVAWGSSDFGGDSSRVGNQLENVQCLQATERAFAAILADGSVVAWGDPEYGGDSTGLKDWPWQMIQKIGELGWFDAVDYLSYFKGTNFSMIEGMGVEDGK